ncbi:acyl-CoA dehydrogenase family protein [Xylophilus sp. Leaf220]|uniref:acyl-CoA dehydrogenase family protein n=1 Tax=Xylophilus sp. Leaf220 TaxID=1735686 RepID=UPI0006F37FAF|nr:acyl-CoA dehydrogenase family protein [Xylophilus sp. Leaf220]KQM71118.1 monooxygenase [Xylophilus sp. Leaf220]
MSCVLSSDPVHTLSPAPQRPSAGELQARMHALLPAIKARAAATERMGRIPAESLAELHDAGLFRVVQPRMFGGHEHDFDVLVDLVMTLGRACASTAWVYGLYAAHQWLVASFDAAAQHDVWSDDADAVVCGSYAPAGQAVAEQGGYRLTGRWAFASGCDGAQWAVCASVLPAADGAPPPGPAFFLVPAIDYRIDGDWEVVGLAGTGSRTLVLDGAFVPQHRILTFKETTSGCTPGRRLHDNPGFGIPMLSNIPSCLAATAVGAAAGALEDYLAMTGQRVTRGAVAGGNNRMAEFPTIQLRVAEAAASVDAAREVLLRDLRARAATVRTGGTVDVDERIASRRGQAFAVSLAIRGAEALNASTGGQGLVLSNPVQRAWRDANAVGRHISLNWDAVGTMAGQNALGLAPKGQY